MLQCENVKEKREKKSLEVFRWAAFLQKKKEKKCFREKSMKKSRKSNFFLLFLMNINCESKV